MTSQHSFIGLFIAAVSAQAVAAAGLAYGVSKLITVPQPIRALTLWAIPEKPISFTSALPIISGFMAAADLAALPASVLALQNIQS